MGVSEYDTNGDGYVDVYGVDTNADGYLDSYGTDTNEDGVLDGMSLDRNEDGVIDLSAVDVNEDGIVDAWTSDDNFDGVVDSSGPAESLPTASDGGSGSGSPNILPDLMNVEESRYEANSNFASLGQDGSSNQDW